VDVLMPEIFISYRRDDSSGHAGRIFDCVRERFGDESVFMDVTDIEPGADFTQALDIALSSCRVVLVVIGTQWLTSTDSSGRRRLDDAEDHLRLEIVRALAHDAHIIPILVRGATMPHEHDLPDDLRPLARRQAHEVSDSRWSFDTDRLIRIVESDLGAIAGGDRRTRADRPATLADDAVARPRNPSRIRVVLPAVVLLVVLGLILARTWLPRGEPTGSVGQPVSTDPGAAAQAVRNSVVPSVAFKTNTRETTLPASGEVRAGSAKFKVLGGLVSRDAGGPRTLRLYVRAINVSAPLGLIIAVGYFRLIVDGQPTPPTEAPWLGVALQSAVEGWVVFQVPSNAGAVALQVGDINHETAKIPIDVRTAGTSVSDKPAPTWRYPVDLATTFETRVGPLIFNVDGARLEHFGDAVPPIQSEKLLLTFKVRIKNAGAPGGALVGGDLFRLLVDDVPLAPTMFPVEGLTYQATLDSDLPFVMPGTATKAILQMGPLNAETAKMRVDLSAAH
jgi:TIR domain-containing protein